MFTYAENCQITILAEATQKSKQTMEARWSAAEFCVIFKKASIYLFIRLGEWKHQFLSSMDPSQLSFTRFPLDWITAYRVTVSTVNISHTHVIMWYEWITSLVFLSFLTGAHTKIILEHFVTLYFPLVKGHISFICRRWNISLTLTCLKPSFLILF